MPRIVNPLLIVRHARAEEDHVLGDEARGLDAKGRDAFRKHARRLRARTEIHGIATSPLVRAVQTAEILADAFALPDVSVRRELVPGDDDSADAARILGLLRELGGGWAFVGHNPGLAAATARALGLPNAIRLRKGAAVALTPHEAGYVLLWLAAPGRPLLTSMTDLA